MEALFAMLPTDWVGPAYLILCVLCAALGVWIGWKLGDDQ